MTEAKLSENPVDFEMVTFLARTIYVDYLESINAPIDSPTWMDLKQIERDHYIRESLKTFGL